HLPVVGVPLQEDILAGPEVHHAVGAGPDDLTGGRGHAPDLVEGPSLVVGPQDVGRHDGDRDLPENGHEDVRQVEADRVVVHLFVGQGLAGNQEPIPEVVGDVGVVD